MKKILTLSCLIILLNGCSGIDENSEEFKEAKELNSHLISNDIVRAKTKILSNSLVNTYHKEDVEAEALERFDDDGYAKAYSKDCIGLFKINSSDLEKVRLGGLRRDERYEVKNQNDVKFDAFKSCIEDKYKSSPVFGSDLRLFLSEPTLMKYRDNPLIRSKLNHIKDDGKLTLEEVISMYELLEKVNITERSKSNEILLKNF